MCSFAFKFKLRDHNYAILVLFLQLICLPVSSTKAECKQSRRLVIALFVSLCGNTVAKCKQSMKLQMAIVLMLLLSRSGT